MDKDVIWGQEYENSYSSEMVVTHFIGEMVEGCTGENLGFGDTLGTESWPLIL